MDKRSCDFPSLDLEKLFTPGIAVVCETREEAEILIESMLRYKPDCMRGWEDRKLHWSGKGSVYTLFYRSGAGWNRGSRNHLMTGSVGLVRNEGYEFITVSDLIIAADIEESDIPLDFLLN